MGSSLTALAQQHADLSAGDLDHLHRLVADWQLLADLSFADLVLLVRRREEGGSGGSGGFVTLAQIRPTTGPTSHADDLVGAVVPDGSFPLLDAAWTEDRICREGDPVWQGDVPVREETIPVRRGDRVIAVIARNTNLASARTPSRLELAYLRSADDLAQMIHEGCFPFAGLPADPDAAPRVGDGLLRLDAGGVVVYASPNALSAYRRLGLTADLVGLHLGRTTAELVPVDGPVDEALSAVLSGRSPREQEIETGGASVQLRSIPLMRGGAASRTRPERIGALVLLRDVTELRRRDRALMTKDATIREIHHRVKNNLQTVAALLRLQARRLDQPAARAALEEAVRRVGSIALVHETLAFTLDEAAAFDDICDRVAGMMTEVTVTGASVEFRRTGSFGVLPALVATPLAMIMTELMQNAVEHGLAGRGGLVEVLVRRDATRLEVVVADDGVGLPEGFAVERSPRLGLQIVRTLVEGELGGSIALRGRPGGGTEAVLDLPLGAAGRRRG